ncbi:MAG: ABC transporter ATP-binding protein [Candidatus Thorarchaeota archaeon]|nr:MAG: ABC transporter ATP-binding protein [Candidatus Thorarchaeota archaeon]
MMRASKQFASVGVLLSARVHRRAMTGGSDEPVLRVENLRAYYTSKRGLVHAVENVSFDVKRGECVGLFGESGAGKTSIALAVIGIFDRVSRYYASASGNEENKRLWELRDEAKKKGLTSRDMGVELPGVEGHIWFEGKDLLALDEEEYRKIRGDRITYVPQGTKLSMNPYMTIGFQTAEPLWAHDEDNQLTERIVLRRVLEVLDLVELGDADLRRFQKPGQFSVGEDQRVLIAMALVTLPTLMIADEPTTAVDVGVRRRILDAIEMAREELGLSMILISNDQGVIAETSDRVAVMSAGRIMEFGPAERVLKRPGHPFTRAFIMSNPTMEVIRKIREKGLVLRGIPGSPPDMTDPPNGCPFHPRCEFATELCKAEIPEYREVERGYWVFCHRYEELPEW